MQILSLCICLFFLFLLFLIFTAEINFCIMRKKRMPKSTRKFIRREKARIRREFLDIKEQEDKIKQIYQKFPKTKNKELKKTKKKKAIKKEKTTKVTKKVTKNEN